MVIGTSMGSIVGGLYAAGWRPEQIESLVQRLDWEGVFSDTVARNRKSFRRKQDDRPVLIQGRLAFDGFKPVLPTGVIRGQKLELILRVIESMSPAASDFDHLPIPYRAVTADIATGEAVVLDSGSLATAMRASMSIPGAFPPVQLDGRALVDGGIAANLPVGIAKELGAVTVIAVDISSPLVGAEEQFSSFAAVVGHLNSLLTAGNVSRDRALIGPNDVLITPELGDISFISFDRVADAARIGEEAARAHADELRRFAASDERWAAFAGGPRLARRPAPSGQHPHRQLSRVNDRIVGRAIGIKPVTSSRRSSPSACSISTTRGTSGPSTTTSRTVMAAASWWSPRRRPRTGGDPCSSASASSMTSRVAPATSFRSATSCCPPTGAAASGSMSSSSAPRAWPRPSSTSPSTRPCAGLSHPRSVSGA
jgi:NTE family protein